MKQRDPQDAVDASDALPESPISRVSTLIQEGALRQACAALLQDPPVQPTDDVVASLRLLHELAELPLAFLHPGALAASHSVPDVAMPRPAGLLLTPLEWDSGAARD